MTKSTRAVSWALWLILLASVPVTSSPLVAQFLGYTPVSPLALLPLSGLALIWFIPYLIRRGRLPGLFAPLAVFAAVTLLAAAAAFTLPIFPFKGQTVFSREVRALVTLAFGTLFYLTASCLPSTEPRLKASLRALYLGLGITLAWSSVQAAIVLSGAVRVPPGLNQIHRLLSIRDLIARRVVGLAYEPSWLGDQLVVLYLPLLLGSVIRGVSVLRRWRWLSLELLLLVWCLPILFLTQSRISLLSLLAMVSVLLVAAGWRAAGWITDHWAPRLRPLRVVFMLVTLAAIAGAMWSAGWVLSRVDPRMSRLLLIPSQLAEIRDERPYEVGYEIADRLAFAERVVYWVAGYRVFEEYPLLGVGLGNSGFFFEKTMPPYGYRLIEVRTALDPANPNFPNPKALWIRLLAETGFVGFAAFGTWYLLVGVSAFQLYRSREALARVIALAALLWFVAQVAEGFSLDSFALPQLWILPGLLDAAAQMDRAGRPQGTN
ncbi:MAG: O-antigen ligase family protein [Chloroflexota bacterium]